MTRAPESSVRPHPFVPDPDVPPDINGRGACLSCHLIGRRGDSHHDTTELDAGQAEARARIGEREE